MIPKNLTLQLSWTFALSLLPIGLWLLLFLSLQSGNIRDFGDPGINSKFLHGIRATFPLIAAFTAVVILAMSVRRRPIGRDFFIGPLGLMAGYGIVGVIASVQSPSWTDSIYWSVSYLSVPLVLWAVVWRPGNFDWVGHLISLNWSILIFATAASFAFGFIYLNLGSFILSPNDWIDCSPQEWFDKSSHFIRDTGVGRYAALTGIISLSRMWHPHRRSLWGFLLVASMVLLLYSGARTAMVGFGAAAPVIVCLSVGKRAAVAALVAAVALTPVVWATGIHNTFIDNCLFRGLGEPAPIQSTLVEPGLSEFPVDPGLSELPNIGDADLSQTPTTPMGSNETSSPPQESTDLTIFGIIKIPNEFFSFTGRQAVWRQSMILFEDSPYVGYGFHADRLLLNTHAHNSFIHSLLQTGVVGTILFLAAMLFAWGLLARASLKLDRFSRDHKVRFIQIAGMLALLSVRSITESTGAFFGVDWLLLGPLLLYLQFINTRPVIGEITDQRQDNDSG